MPSKRRREKESISSSLYLSRLLVIGKGRKPLQMSLGKCGTENLVWPDRLKQELISDRGSRDSAASMRISVLLFQFAFPWGLGGGSSPTSSGGSSKLSTTRTTRSREGSYLRVWIKSQGIALIGPVGSRVHPLSQSLPSVNGLL